MTKPTKNQVEAYLNAVRAIADAIKSLGQAPAGHLYAAVMGSMDLATFEGIISRLVAAGLVTRAPSHLLTWVGPK